MGFGRRGGGSSCGADALPACLLVRIAREVVAHAESELMDPTGACPRCPQCGKHWHLRCACLEVRAGFWDDALAPMEIDRCTLGRPMPDPTNEFLDAWRMKVLGTTHVLRQVSRFWRDVIGYGSIDMLRLDVEIDECDYAQDLPVRRRTAAKPFAPPTDFALRFSGVVLLDLSGLLLETLPDLRPMAQLTGLRVNDHYLGALPPWVAALHLTELQLSCGPITRAAAGTELAVERALRRRRHAYYQWLYSTETRFPATLRCLRVGLLDDFFQLTQRVLSRLPVCPAYNGKGARDEMPPCFRYLPNLQVGQPVELIEMDSLPSVIGGYDC